MKLEDLTSEQQEHFKQVVEYCKEKGLEEQLEESTYIDQSSLHTTLMEITEDVNYYYSQLFGEWVKTASELIEPYQKPDKPWNFS